MSILGEIRRSNVFQVAAVYLAKPATLCTGGDGQPEESP
jgi:hypothetical protein